MSAIGLPYGADAHAGRRIRGPDHEVQARAHGSLPTHALPASVRSHAVSASLRTNAVSAPVRTDALPASV